MEVVILLFQVVQTRVDLIQHGIDGSILWEEKDRVLTDTAQSPLPLIPALSTSGLAWKALGGTHVLPSGMNATYFNLAVTEGGLPVLSLGQAYILLLHPLPLLSSPSGITAVVTQVPAGLCSPQTCTQL